MEKSNREHFNAVMDFFDTHSETDQYKKLKELNVPDVITEHDFLIHTFSFKPLPSEVLLVGKAAEKNRKFDHYPHHAIVVSGLIYPAGTIFLIDAAVRPEDMNVVVLEKLLLRMAKRHMFYLCIPAERAIEYLVGIKDKIDF